VPVTVAGEQLREAMRRAAAPVAVVTVDAVDLRYALTVGSLLSLSLEPALVGVSIGHASQSHSPMREAGRFAASLLAGDQASLAQHFARSVPPIALWEGIELHESEVPEPLLEGAVAWLECGVVEEYEAGDHTIFVGQVLSVELGRPAPALVYVGGEYRSV
jgi:flavin reductase (DIM6/NTAB) family NADH-FMN oxidoreductase RutF